MAEVQDETQPYQSFLDAYATTAKGRRRAFEILDCALDILAKNGFEQVTLREVARRLEMSIGNLQHYFPTRESLVEAMLTSVMQQYDVAYSRLEGMDTAAPRDRLIKVIRYLLADISNPRTNGIFFELWAQANRNPFASQIMAKMYRHHIESIEKLIYDVNKDLTPQAARTRAVIIASMIEGLMIFLADRREKFFDVEDVISTSVNQILALATGN